MFLIEFCTQNNETNKRKQKKNRELYVWLFHINWVCSSFSFLFSFFFFSLPLLSKLMNRKLCGEMSDVTMRNYLRLVHLHKLKWFQVVVVIAWNICWNEWMKKFEQKTFHKSFILFAELLHFRLWFLGNFCVSGSSLPYIFPVVHFN